MTVHWVQLILLWEIVLLLNSQNVGATLLTRNIWFKGVKWVDLALFRPSRAEPHWQVCVSNQCLNHIMRACINIQRLSSPCWVTAWEDLHGFISCEKSWFVCFFFYFNLIGILSLQESWNCLMLCRRHNYSNYKFLTSKCLFQTEVQNSFKESLN